MSDGLARREEIEVKKMSSERKTSMQAALTDSKKSALEKYQEMVIGSSSLAALIKYELLVTLLGPIPGALGLLLRKVFFKSLFRKVGRNVIFGRSLTIRHPGNIEIGDNVIIDDFAVLDAKGDPDKRMVIGDDVIVGRSTVLSCKNGNMTIGRNTNIAMNCFFQSAKEVVIGQNVLFAAYCYVIGGGNHRTDRTDIPIISQGQVVRGVTIEDNCWIGAGVKVQDGVTIHRDAIIGSGAVVTKDIPAFAIAVGIPAKVVKNRKEAAG